MHRSGVARPNAESISSAHLRSAPPTDHRYLLARRIWMCGRLRGGRCWRGSVGLLADRHPCKRVDARVSEDGSGDEDAAETGACIVADKAVAGECAGGGPGGHVAGWPYHWRAHMFGPLRELVGRIGLRR